MRSRILVPLVTVACLVPAASASARPIYDAPINAPEPPAAAPVDSGGTSDSGAGVLGYALVGLGGVALGAGGAVTVRRSRRVAVA